MSLIEEVKSGNVSRVSNLLQFGVDLNTTDSRSLTALHYAVEKGYVDIVELLVRNGADANIRDQDNGFTPLHRAVIMSNIKCIELLLSSKTTEVDIQDSQGLSPLNYAEKTGRQDIVKLLSSKRNNGYLPSRLPKKLMVGKASHESSNGVDEATSKKDNRSSVILNNVPAEIAKRLGLNRNKFQGIPPIVAAAKASNVNELATLLDKGDAVDTRDNDGNTPIYCAAEVGSVACVALCIERRADVNCANENGWTPLHAAAYGATKEHEACAGMLIGNGASITAINNNNQTPLQVAMRRNASETLLRLLRQASVSDSIDKVRKLASPAGGLDAEKREAVQIILEQLESAQNEVEQQKQLNQQLTMSLSAANDALRVSTLAAVQASSNDDGILHNSASPPPVSSPPVSSPPLSPRNAEDKPREEKETKEKPKEHLVTKPVIGAKPGSCYNCMQLTFQLNRLSMMNDDLSARCKKLTTTVARNTQASEIKVMEMEAKVHQSESERKAALDELEVSRIRMETAYMNKLAKLSQEMEVALRQVQTDLAESDQARHDLLAAQQKTKKLTWVPDDLVTVCLGFNCGKKFDQTVRKHHCRCCGRVFCSSCSTHRTALPKLGFTKPVRVCDSCFMLVTGQSTAAVGPVMTNHSVAGGYESGGEDDVNYDSESEEPKPRRFSLGAAFGVRK